MKKIALFICLLLLAACAAPAVELAVDSSLPTVVASAPPATGTSAPPPAPTLTATPAPVASVLMVGWDKTLKSGVIRAIDPATGQDVAGRAPIPFVAGRDQLYDVPDALSADGQRAAIFELDGSICRGYAGGSACYWRSDAVHVIDVRSWTARLVPLPAGGWVGPLAFSPDGATLAVGVQTGDGDQLLLIDVTRGEVAAQTGLAFEPAEVGFGDGGRTLVVYGQPPGEEPGVTRPGAPQVALLDATSLTVKWEATLDEVTSGFWCSAKCDEEHGVQETAMWTPGVALSPDGDTLYILHADDDRLTVVDLARQSVRNLSLSAPKSWLERLLAATAGVAHAKGPMNGTTRSVALSPDGTRLYATGYSVRSDVDLSGNWTLNEDQLPLQVINPSTGMVLAQREVDAQTVRLTPDGGRLLLGGWTERGPVTRVLDAKTLAPIADVTGPDVVFTLDSAGQARIVGQPFYDQPAVMSVLDPTSLKSAAEWRVDGPASWLER